MILSYELKTQKKVRESNKIRAQFETILENLFSLPVSLYCTWKLHTFALKCLYKIQFASKEKKITVQFPNYNKHLIHMKKKKIQRFSIKILTKNARVRMAWGADFITWSAHNFKLLKYTHIENKNSVFTKNR